MLTTSPPARRHRRWQFSLRALLLLMMIVSAPLGWLAVKKKQAKQQQIAAGEIKRLGGTALHCGQYEPKDDHWLRDVKWLRQGLGDEFFVTINYVSLPGAEVSDADLVQLRSLPQLRALHLPRCPISDEGLVPVGGLVHLRRLNLKSTQITDEGLARLAHLRELTHLDLGKTRITDAGLRHLSGLEKLEELNLQETAVTDVGIADLRKRFAELVIRQ